MKKKEIRQKDQIVSVEAKDHQISTSLKGLSVQLVTQVKLNRMNSWGNLLILGIFLLMLKTHLLQWVLWVQIPVIFLFWLLKMITLMKIHQFLEHRRKFLAFHYHKYKRFSNWLRLIIDLNMKTIINKKSAIN